MFGWSQEEQGTAEAGKGCKEVQEGLLHLCQTEKAGENLGGANLTFNPEHSKFEKR